MRLLLLAAVLALAPACTDEDPYTLRPPGGHGGGNHVTPPDAGEPPDASLVDAGPQPLTGEVCVVLDVTAREACPAIQTEVDVTVSLDGTATPTTSDADGLFTIDMFGATDVIQVGAGAIDGLVTTRMNVALADAPIRAPAIDETTWETLLASLGQTQPAAGSMLIYVVDDSGPVAGASLGDVGGGLLYYDDGAGGFDASATATGSDGIALILDTGTLTLTATEGARSSEPQLVPTIVAGVGVGVLTLPTP